MNVTQWVSTPVSSQWGAAAPISWDRSRLSKPRARKANSLQISIRASESSSPGSGGLNAADAFGAAANVDPSGMASSIVRQRLQSGADAAVAGRTNSGLPLREIPGSYGWPIFGALRDRWDFYWFQQDSQFYTSRVKKYGSTIYRVNLATGWPGYPDPKCIMLLDEKSFPVLFDMTKVEKKNCLVGNFLPSTGFNGGFRMLAYLDPSEENHENLKAFCFDMLKRSAPRWNPETEAFTSELFTNWERKMKADGKFAVTEGITSGSFKFLVKTFLKRDPTAPGKHSLGEEASSVALIWGSIQILPSIVLPAPKILAPLVEILLHTFPIPAFVMKSRYTKLVDFFREYSTELLDNAEREFQLDREEALHNLIFNVVFNAFGGFNIALPTVVEKLAGTSADFQMEVATEVREYVKKNGALTVQNVGNLPLVRSCVYEVLRIAPPVTNQYGRAKQDLIIESHDAAFRVKKGELMGGTLSVIMKDPLVFKDPHAFMPKRFMGEEGEKLLSYVLWSNGRETENSTVHNKQCAGKNIVIPLLQLFVAKLYSRYDSLELSADRKTITSLKLAQPAA